MHSSSHFLYLHFPNKNQNTIMSNIIDGKQLATTIKNEIAEEVKKLREEGGKIPHLAAVLVGEDPASQVYVRNKVRSCEECGFESTLIKKSA